MKGCVSCKCHWLKPLAILCCMVNAVSADTFGLFTYTDNGTSITITGYPTSATGAVVIPDTIVGKPVTSIGYSAFLLCRSLTSVTIPTGVTSIADNAFYHCGLTSVTIPTSVTSIGNHAFFTSGLTSVTIPSGVTSIGHNSFDNCSSLTSVTIQSGVTSIGTSAFGFCIGLTSVTIPASVTSIGDVAFQYCSHLAYANFLGNAPTMGSQVFNYAGTGFTAYFIPENTGYTVPTWQGYPSIGKFAPVIAVQLPPVGTGIDNGGSKDFGSVAVESDHSLTFTIKNTGNVDLTGLTITEDGANQSDFSVTTDPVVPVSGGGSTSFIVNFTPTAIGNRTAAIHIASNDPTGNPYNITLTGTGTVTGTFDLFIYLDNGTSVTIIGHIPTPAGAAVIPASIAGKPVTSIGNYALQNCTGLTSVTIPSTVTSIGNYAFSGCSALTGVTIPTGVTSIGSSVFQNCTGLTSVTIPTGITSFETYAFSGCSGLLSVVIPSGVTSIGSSAFSGCSGLISVAIPSSVTSFGTHAFSGCTSLTSVTIPPGVNIGDYAFETCSGLTSVNISSGVTTIGYAAFGLCTNLTSLTIPSSITSFGAYAFTQCRGLTSVTLSSGLHNIGYSAFYLCVGLTSLTIPSSVTSIGASAFQYCSRLTSVCFLGNAPTMGAGVYAGANRVTSFFFNGSNGFTTPTWQDHPAVNMGAPSPVAPWLLSNGFAYNTALESDSNGDGVSLLMAYALKLDPNKNLSGSMPKPGFAGNTMSLDFFAGSAGVSYIVECSSNLKTWSTAGVTLSALDAGDYRTATVNMSDRECFLRLGAAY